MDGTVPGPGPRLRLFGLLASLVPLFGGLQYLADESAPRVEVRLVASAPSSNEVVQAPVERVVERIVYVPVERSQTTSLNATQTRMAATGHRRAETTNATALSGLDSANTALAQAAPTEPSEARVVAETSDADVPAVAPTEHMGLLAMATPVPVAAPAVRSAPVVARVPQPQPVAEPGDDEEVAEADTTGDENTGDEVAEAAADAEDETVEVAQVQVIDTTIEADQSTHVVLYRVPVQAAPEASPAHDSPANDDDEEAAAPPDGAPVVADAPDAAPTDDADGELTDVAAKVVQAASDDNLSKAPTDPTTADGGLADESDQDDAGTAPADDGDDADVDADAETPGDIDERPQLSVTVAATSNGAFVSDDGSGQ